MKSKEISDLKSSLSRRLMDCKPYKNGFLLYQPWDLEKFNTPEKKLNSIWKRESYWKNQIPQEFYQVVIKHPENDDNNSQKYKCFASSHLRLNDDFIAFVNDTELIEGKALQLWDNSKRYKLKQKENDLKIAIQQNHQRARQYLQSLPEYFIQYIEKRAITVKDYEHDDATHKMQELLSGAEIAFQASILGNESAIRNLLSRYTKRKGKYLETIKNLIELNKQYLIHQIATKKTKQPARKRWYFLKEIYNDLESLTNINDNTVRSVFKSYDQEFCYTPKRGYFTQEGKPKAKPFGEAMAEIYNNKENWDEGITYRAITDKFDFSVLHEFK